MPTNNKKIKIVPKEEMLGESEKWFAGMIKYIEKEIIRKDPEEIWEKIRDRIGVATGF